MSAPSATPDQVTSTSMALAVSTIVMLAGVLILVVGYWIITFLWVALLRVLPVLKKNRKS